MSSSEVIKILKEIPLFQSLSDEHLSLVSKGFTIKKYKKGEIIFYQSDDSTDLYIILNGAVKACLLNSDGQELVLTTFKKGDFFGEMSFLDGRPRSATIITAEDSTLGILKRDKFLQAVKNDPMIAIDLLSALVQRMRMTDEMVGSLAFLDVSQRIIKLLLNIAKTGETRNENGFFKIKKLTHKELASCTGASREAVTKSLKVLFFRNIVTEEDGYFLISPDAERM